MAAGALERFDRLGPLLHLLRRDVADLVVGQLVTQLLLSVRHGGGEHPERAEPDLLARSKRVRHLVGEPLLQRRIAHYTPPVLPVVVTIAVLGVGCVLYGIFIERFRYRVLRHRLDILPAAAARPLVVLHLSDLHFVRHDPRKARFLAALPTPDVTVVTGDFLAEPEAIEAAVEGVRPVRGRLASWFVLGSNDYFVPKPLNYFAYFWKGRKRRPSPSRPRPRAHPTRWSPTVGRTSRTSAATCRSKGSISSCWAWMTPTSADTISASRLGAPRNGSALAVMHSPDSAPEAAALGYGLIVAGHTHGGQVRLPFVGALVTNCSMPPRLASGLDPDGRRRAPHISRGLGTSKYAPFRFWCRPEATFLELRPRLRPRPRARLLRTGRGAVW